MNVADSSLQRSLTKNSTVTRAWPGEPRGTRSPSTPESEGNVTD
jgi:hypothetical protein